MDLRDAITFAGARSWERRHRLETARAFFLPFFLGAATLILLCAMLVQNYAYFVKKYAGSVSNISVLVRDPVSDAAARAFKWSPTNAVRVGFGSTSSNSWRLVMLPVRTFTWSGLPSTKFVHHRSTSFSVRIFLLLPTKTHSRKISSPLTFFFFPAALAGVFNKYDARSIIYYREVVILLMVNIHSTTIRLVSS